MKEKNRKEKLAGGYLPRQANDLLNLMVLYYDTTKSSIVRSVVEVFIQKGPSAKTMINDLTKRYYTNWINTPINYKEPLDIYCNDLTSHLIEKGIAPGYVESIIQGVMEERKKNEKNKAG